MDEMTEEKAREIEENFLKQNKLQIRTKAPRLITFVKGYLERVAQEKSTQEKQAENAYRWGVALRSRANGKIYRQCCEMITKTVADGKKRLEVTFMPWEVLESEREKVRIAVEALELFRGCYEHPLDKLNPCACGTGCDMGEAGPGAIGQHDPECMFPRVMDALSKIKEVK